MTAAVAPRRNGRTARVQHHTDMDGLRVELRVRRIEVDNFAVRVKLDAGRMRNLAIRAGLMDVADLAAGLEHRAGRELERNRSAGL